MHLQDVPNLGLWQTDFKTGETFWSKELFLMYGLKPEVHSPSLDVLMKYLHRDDRDMVSDVIHAATKTLTPFEFFFRIVRKDRSTRSLYTKGRFQRDATSGVTSRYGFSLDLTDLAKDELVAFKNKIAGSELPSLNLLSKLDPADKTVSFLLEIAAKVTRATQDKIGRSNLSARQ